MVDINELLGAFEHRYFGAGHKRANYVLDKCILNEERIYQGNAKIKHTNGVWSKKKSMKLRPHLSTIDGVILGVMCAENYMKENVKDCPLANLFLSSFEIKAGVSPIENLDRIPLFINKMEILNNNYKLVYHPTSCKRFQD